MWNLKTKEVNKHNKIEMENKQVDARGEKDRERKEIGERDV